MRRAKTAHALLHVRQIWRAFFIALALLGVGASTALAAAPPLTGTYTGRIVGRQIKFDRGGKQVNDWAGVLNLRLDSGENVPVYCIEVDVLVRPGDRYRSDGQVLALPNGCKLRYLLDKYPASSAKTADEAAARQLALWAFSDGVDLTTITDTTTIVRDRAIALMKEAQRAPCPPPQRDLPSLTLEPPVAGAPDGQTVNYVIHAGPGGAGLSATVTVNGPATLPNGQQQITLPLDAQGDAAFAVTGTGAGRSDVRVALPYQLLAGTVFSHLDSARKTQRLVAADKRTITAQATAQINWSAAAPSATPTEAPTERPKPRPTSAPNDTPTPTPEATAEQPTPEQPTPEATVEQPTPEQSTPEAAIPQTAGGAGSTRPRSLPRTGAPAGTPAWPLAGLAALASVGGWLIRRRARR